MTIAILTFAYGLAVVLKLQDTGSSDRITNSFIKHPMPADALPNSIGLTDQVTGTIKDYNVDPLFDNVITTIHDRLNFRIEVNRTAYNAQVSTLLGLGQTWAQGFNADLRKVWFVMQEEATLAPAGPNTYTPFSNLVNTIPGVTAVHHVPMARPRGMVLGALASAVRDVMSVIVATVVVTAFVTKVVAELGRHRRRSTPMWFDAPESKLSY